MTGREEYFQCAGEYGTLGSAAFKYQIEVSHENLPSDYTPDAGPVDSRIACPRKAISENFGNSTRRFQLLTGDLRRSSKSACYSPDEKSCSVAEKQPFRGRVPIQSSRDTRSGPTLVQRSQAATEACTPLRVEPRRSPCSPGSQESITNVLIVNFVPPWPTRPVIRPLTIRRNTPSTPEVSAHLPRTHQYQLAVTIVE